MLTEKDFTEAAESVHALCSNMNDHESAAVARRAILKLLEHGSDGDIDIVSRGLHLARAVQMRIKHVHLDAEGKTVMGRLAEEFLPHARFQKPKAVMPPKPHKQILEDFVSRPA